MSASKNETKQARQHSIASANASSHASHTGLAVQPPVVQLSIQEEDENQPQPENQIQKTKEFSANPNGDDPGNTPPANPNQGNGSGKGILPFQLKASSDTQPIHSFLSGKSNERRTAVIQQSPDAVHQFLNGNNTVLQRKVEGGAEVGTAGGKVNLGFSTTKEIKMKYATGTITPKAIGVGELKPKQDHPGSVSGSQDGAKTSIKIYTREASEQGSAKLEETVYKEIESNWLVEDVEWENELGKGENEKGMGSASMATGVKFIFKNGHEVVVKAQLFEKSAGAGLSGPKFTVEPTFKFQNNTLWENEHAKLTYNGEFSLAMSIAPNWSEIFKYLAKKGGRVVARLFAKAAMTGAAGALVIKGGMIAGGALAAFAAVRSIIDAGHIEECKKQAHLAVYSYVRGWCTAWGINKYGAGGIAEYVSKGSADAHVKLIEAVGKIQQNPVFAPWDFTQEELIPLLKEKLPEHAKTVFDQVKLEVEKPIFRVFVVNFYHQSKNWYTPNGITRKNAIWVARGLGLMDEAEQLVPKE